MIGIPLAMAYASAVEFVAHKYVLHGLGKRPGNFFNFHWREHHRSSRLHDFRDPDYERSLLSWNAQSKEALALAGLALVHLPLAPVAPFFTATAILWELNYYRVHRKAHLDPDWAREHLPWHYDHHMGPDMDANWGVTVDWIDRLMGTRKRFLSDAASPAPAGAG